jgi:hypothetical protein
MDYQGARRGRHGAGQGQSPWPADQAPWTAAEEPDYGPPGPPVPVGPGSGRPPGTQPQPVLGLSSGPQPVLGAASGPQPILGLGSGSQRTIGSATGPQRSPGSPTGPQRITGSATGSQRITGSPTGPQRITGSATGPQRAIGRTPARGFPPVSPGAPAPTGPMGWEQPEPSTVTFRPWPSPGAPQAGDGDGGYYDGIGVGVGHDWDGGPVPPASMAPALGGPDSGYLDGGDPDGGDPDGGPRRGARGGRSGRPRRHPARVVAWLGLVVVLAAAAFGGYKYLYEPRVNAPVSAGLKLPTDAPGGPNFDPALGKWQHIGNKNQDPAPLTLAQLYPPQFVLNGSSYQRTAATVTKNCSLAVFGSDLQAALQAGDCTAILRASYLLGNGTMMGTVGVANLDSSSAAQKAGQATGPQNIIAPLSGKKGPTAKLGSGTGVVQAEIKGHYLILMWVEFTSGKSPSTAAQRQQLETFAANLVTGSANIDLSTRMLSGKP